MTGTPKRVDTYAIRRRNARILRASDICHVCGEPGADAVDHVRPFIPRDPTNPWNQYDPEAGYNLKPIHHNVPNTAGVRCNRVKGNRDPDVDLTTSRQW